MKRYKAVVVPVQHDVPDEGNLAITGMEVTFTVGDTYVTYFMKTLPPGSVPGTALARLMGPRGVGLGEGGSWRVDSLEEIHPNGLPVREPYDPRHRAPLADATEEEISSFLDRD